MRRQAVPASWKTLDAPSASSSIAHPTNQPNNKSNSQSLHKSPLPAHRIQKQQQCGAQQPLRRNRRTLGRTSYCAENAPSSCSSQPPHRGKRMERVYSYGRANIFLDSTEEMEFANRASREIGCGMTLEQIERKFLLLRNDSRYIRPQRKRPIFSCRLTATVHETGRQWRFEGAVGSQSSRLGEKARGSRLSRRFSWD